MDNISHYHHITPPKFLRYDIKDELYCTNQVTDMDTKKIPPDLSLEQMKSLIPYLGGLTLEDMMAYTDERNDSEIDVRTLVKHSYLFGMKFSPRHAIKTKTVDPSSIDGMYMLTSTMMYKLFHRIITCFISKGIVTDLQKAELIKYMSLDDFATNYIKSPRYGFRPNESPGVLKISSLPNNKDSSGFNHEFLPEERSFWMRFAAQKMTIIFEKICDAIRDEPTGDVDVYDILRSPKFLEFPSLVCKFYGTCATYKTELENAILNCGYGKLRAAWCIWWYLDTEPNTTDNQIEVFSVTDANVIRAMYGTDELVWRKFLDTTFGNLASVKTGITELKKKTMSAIIQDDDAQSENKKGARKLWYGIAKKRLENQNQNRMSNPKRNIDDPTAESAHKRQAIQPAGNPPVAKLTDNDKDKDKEKDAADALLALKDKPK